MCTGPTSVDCLQKFAMHALDSSYLSASTFCIPY